MATADGILHCGRIAAAIQIEHLAAVTKALLVWAEFMFPAGELNVATCKAAAGDQASLGEYTYTIQRKANLH